MTSLKTVIAVALAVSSAPIASGFAADGTPASRNDPTPAIADDGTHHAAAPSAGANSFTESQAKARIEKAGYADVSGLAKDKDGVWRGTASKDGAKVPVALDFKGNVVAN